MRSVLAVVPDLFFATKITAVARAAGATCEVVAGAALLERCAAAAPELVLLDLHAPGAVALAATLRADPRTRALPVIGFYSHVETALGRAAVATGIEALPRSAFVRRLPALLAGEAGAAPGGTPA